MRRGIGGRNLGVHEAPVATGAAVGRESEKAMERFFEGAVRVGFPNGTALALRTFVESRFVPEGESHQVHPCRSQMRDLSEGTRCRPPSNAACIYANHGA